MARFLFFLLLYQVVVAAAAVEGEGVGAGVEEAESKLSAYLCLPCHFPLFHIIRP